MMLKVGLTGNIGSGKTLVAGIFNRLGVPVFHADTQAKELFNLEEVKERVHDLFGPNVFTAGNEIDRKAVASIVFNSEPTLKKLNDIIHPKVREKYLGWLSLHRDRPYTLYEAAILFESGHYREMDSIICVTAPEGLRIRRVMERDGASEEEIRERMKFQWDESKKTGSSDHVIVNDGLQMIIPQVMELHRVLTVAANG